jgi:hypothetical protein
VSMTFICPACGKALTMPDEAAGKQGQCAYCNALIEAPASHGEPARLVEPSAPDTPYAAGNSASTYATPTGNLDFGSILGDAWKLVTSNLGLVIGVAIVVFGIIILADAIIEAIAPSNGPDKATNDMLTLITNLVFLPMNFSFAYVFCQIIGRGRSTFGAAFHGYRQWWSLFVTAFIIGACMIPGLVLVFAGATFVSNSGILGGLLVIAGFIVIMMIIMGVFLAPYEVVDKGKPPLEAVQTSWSVTKGRRLTLFVYSFLFGIIGLAGILACGVGLLVTLPLSNAGIVLMYQRLRGIQGTLYE